MTTFKVRAPSPDDLDQLAENIRHAENFESMRGLLGELPPGIFPPKSEFGSRGRRSGVSDEQGCAADHRAG